MPPVDIDRKRVAVRIAVRICDIIRLDAGLLARRKTIAPVEDAPLGIEHDRLQKPALFDVGRKLVELVIGEHRKQRGDSRFIVNMQ
jgi:hypothetical protein